MAPEQKPDQRQGQHFHHPSLEPSMAEQITTRDKVLFLFADQPTIRKVNFARKAGRMKLKRPPGFGLRIGDVFDDSVGLDV
jgi:hypothetical protein